MAKGKQIWFISDLHFGHSKVIYYSQRPFMSLQDMHSALIKNWNAAIKPDDLVYVLGDLSFLPYKDFLPIAAQLNGVKTLIRGNHDNYSYGQYRQAGFTICEEAVILLSGRRVRLSHFPYRAPWWRRIFYKSEDRYVYRRPKRGGAEFLLHGHSHYKKKLHKDMIHIGVDAWDFKPVSASQIESLWALK